MMLGNLIAFLKARDPKTKVPVGFGHPHSYRGYYEDLAFEIRENTTVGEMLAAAKEALGNTYYGWKGGEYTMDDATNAWLVKERGMCGEGIGEVLLRYMVGEIRHA